MINNHHFAVFEVVDGLARTSDLVNADMHYLVLENYKQHGLYLGHHWVANRQNHCHYGTYRIQRQMTWRLLSYLLLKKMDSAKHQGRHRSLAANS